MDGVEFANRRRKLILPRGVDFTSNDYLGMAQHPALRQAAIAALEGGMDVGAAGSRLLRGHCRAHQGLEEYAADYFGAGRSLYFANGFAANYALLTTLPARGDVVLYDSLVHASMRDGLKSAQARSFKFAHNDLNALEDLLRRHRDGADQIWIAVESVYSMDGDLAPLREMYALAQRYDAYLIIDEAHASGIYGDGGRGCAYELIAEHGYARMVTLHTCGKAIGVAGGLVCADARVIDYLINFARPFIYSTAPMPLQAYLVQKSLEILDSDEGARLRAALADICIQAHDVLGGAGSHIIPVILGDDGRALAVAQAMQAKGYDVRAIRPPTVPNGTARLRVSLSTHITASILQEFTNDLKLCMDHHPSD